jgi:hypothetical protein
MEINSRYCEVSTYAASSGYNSSTASSSLNYIDEDLSTDNHCDLIVDPNNNVNSESVEEVDQEDKTVTRLIITITLVKSEQVEKNYEIEILLEGVRMFFECYVTLKIFEKIIQKVLQKINQITSRIKTKKFEI